jgi:hypothetical protein
MLCIVAFSLMQEVIVVKRQLLGTSAAMSVVLLTVESLK